MSSNDQTNIIVNDIANNISQLQSSLPFSLSPDAIFIIMISAMFLFFASVAYGYGTWFIILFIAAAIVFIIINVIITMGSQNNFQFGPFTLFMIVIVICGYVLTGLYITEGIETLMMLMLVWGVYTLMALTFLNVLIVGLFWSVVRKKTGMSGVRGISGNRGEQGPRGQCDVNSVQNYTIMTLSNTIDKLYKQQPGNSNVSIIDPTSHRLINNYLNTKISDMASSHQINMLVNVSMVNRVPLAQLVNYLANIWTTWFNLIYAAGGSAWFNNIYGDENGPWVNTTGSQPTATGSQPTATGSQPTATGSYPTAHPTETAPLNPFIEIRKYDVYNWGLTRSFRPLKIEVCQSTIDHENPDLPIKKQPQLKVIASNDYKLVSSDKNVAGGSPNISWWRANKATINNDVYYPVGDVPMAGPSDIVYNAAFKTGKTILGTMEYDVKKGTSGTGTVNGPDIQTILISGDVKEPISYQNTSNYAGEFNPGLWRPVCPQGYISLGDVASIGSNIGINNPPVCVPEKCVEPIGQDGNTIWTNGTGIIKNINGWFWGAPDDNTPQPNYSYNLMRSDTKANTSTSNGSNVFYKLRPDCLNVGNNAPSTKNLEKSTAQLGVGWYGSPAKLEPKYSIFSFLGMVPEGLILHQGTGRRFYVVHYGGDDLNKFIVLDYNGGTGNFDGALQVDSDTNSVMISLQDIVYTDARQQWIIDLTTQYSRTDNGKKIFVLNSVYNNRSLYLGLEPTLGEAIFSTINLANPGVPYTSLSAQVLTNSVTFSFIPAVGVHTDVLDTSV